MKLPFIKRIIYVAMIFVGIFDLAYFLFHDKFEAKISHYGFNDKIAIVLGVSFVIIGMLMFLLEKSRVHMRGILAAKVNLIEALLMMVLIQ